MVGFVPSRIFLTKGAGRHKEKLASFELALREARIARFNLVRVSSIFPPGCKTIPRNKGLSRLDSGEVVFCVLSENATNEPHRLISSSIGVAVPRDSSKWGYLSEVHDYGMKTDQAADMSEDLAASMLGTTLGYEVDPDKAWSEKEQAYKSSGLFIRTTNITQTARGRKDLWATAVALAVFIFE